jgi:Uma2 family endonuclease
MNALPHYDPDDPYPESDGQPMAENTEQYEWLVKIKENLEILFAQDPNVFIAGDLFWYPVPDRRISGPVAPDVMVAIGRPKGRRGSYKQWEEGGIAPQVVFEILSPANSAMEMADKLAFYDTFGVEEYYVYDPSANTLEVWLRQEGHLRRMSPLRGWTSPRLGIRFALTGETLEIFDPQGQPFLSSVELAQRARQAASLAEQAIARADEAITRADVASARAEDAQARAAAAAALAAQQSIRVEQVTALAEQATARAEQERERAERLAERLRALGIEP